MEELNIKPKYWKDLIDDTPFTRKDIIHLQDPLNLEVGNAVESSVGEYLCLAIQVLYIKGDFIQLMAQLQVN